MTDSRYRWSPPRPAGARLVPAVAVATLLVLSLSVPGLAAPQVGKPAPEFSGTASDGKTYALRDLRGKTVVLEWTNHLCPYVDKHYSTGNMQALQREATSAGDEKT